MAHASKSREAPTGTEHVAAADERFVARHGSDLVLVEGKELAEIYADAIVPAGDREAEPVASSRAMARRTIEDSELADADHVRVNSHPVAGFGFSRDLWVSHARWSAGALPRPDFSWDRDGERLLAATPGDHDPTVTLAIVPSLCSK